jgi:Domain of unknown function (DUF6265)
MMRNSLRLGLILGIAAAIPLTGAGQADKMKIGDLAWMAGSWTGSMDGNAVERSCSQLTAGSMMCMMRVIAGQQVVWMEFSMMRATADGIVLDTRFFTGDGQPSPPVSTELRLKSASPDEAIFENPNGTQPKLESVTRNGPDSMSSHADLVDSKGKASTMEMAWTRVR